MSDVNLSKLFNDTKLNQTNLKEDESLLKNILKLYKKEIEILSDLDDSQIEKRLLEVSNYDDDSQEFNKSKENLLYIKQSYYIEKQEKEEVRKNIDIDINILKDLKLNDLVDVKNIIENKEVKIEFDKLKNVIDLKKAEKEKWNEYNIVTTLSNYLNIPECNIEFISCLEEYIQFISKLDNAVNYVSRGQKDCTFKLVPSLHRIYSNDYAIHKNIYESAFKQKIVYYDKEIKNKSPEELRAEGQHFGLPTDYLDFTEAHLISLLFAVEDYKYTQQHSIVYFIDSYTYNQDTIKHAEKLIDYSDETFVDSNKRYESRSFFIKLGNSNERIHFQKGCFLKTSHEDKDEFEKKLGKYCKIVVINKESKKEILKELFNLGITFENIYPDKDNVVRSIRFYYEEMIGDDL